MTGPPGVFQGAASFAESTQYDEFTSVALQTTASNDWVEAVKFEVPEERDDGIYTIQWSMKAGQSKGGRDFGIQISYRLGQDADANAWAIIDSIDTLQVPSDNSSFPFSGFSNVTIATTGFFQVRVEFGQTDNGGEAQLSKINLITFRVGDNP